jgi:multisubunit Na+/H+ antiporter MnhE subunit
VLAIAGLIIIVVYHRKEAFWRYVVFGAIVSVVPSSLTQDPFHMLRLIAVPVFLIMLMVPALMWLVKSAEQASQPLKQGLLAGAAALTLFQAVTFQIKYRTEGPTRGVWFDEGYAKLLETAIADPSRPIYLVDGYWGQAYAHAYWYAIVNGIDRSVFVHLEPGRRPPPGALVLSSEDKCTRCAIVAKGEPFLLYREGQ